MRIVISEFMSLDGVCQAPGGPEADITWPNSHLIAGDGALDAIRALKAREGGDLQVMGSLTLARSLLEADLVDELNLMIEPVSLGGGKRLFPDDGNARPMRLVS